MQRLTVQITEVRIDLSGPRGGPRWRVQTTVVDPLDTDLLAEDTVVFWVHSPSMAFMDGSEDLTGKQYTLELHEPASKQYTGSFRVETKK